MSQKSRIAAIVFGVVVVVAIIVAAATGGVTRDDVPKGNVARVGDAKISEDQFNHELELATAQQGVQAPEPGSEEETQLRESVLDSILQQELIAGETADQGLEGTDQEITDRLAQIKQQQFKTEKAFQDFLSTSGFTEDDVNARVKNMILTEKWKSKING